MINIATEIRNQKIINAWITLNIIILKNKKNQTKKYKILDITLSSLRK